MLGQDDFEALLRAETAKDVLDILQERGWDANDDMWEPLGSNPSNFATIDNQQSEPEKALTELMTNMVDAMLLKMCREKGIDPDSQVAPQTTYEAIERFIEERKIRGGRLTNLDKSDGWIREFASKNLIVGITGPKKGGYPSFTFIDNGEGQRPEDFKDTFLSLNESKKKDIPFVQGRFSMGSTGVLQFAGTIDDASTPHGYKLICSKSAKKGGHWGWTLVRYHARGNNHKIGEYLVDSDKTIPAFDKDIVFPLSLASGKDYREVSWSSGTIIKVYSYFMDPKPAVRRTRDPFYQCLVETPLPFRLMDFRALPDKGRGKERELGIDSRNFCGMDFHLSREQSDNFDEQSELMESLLSGKNFRRQLESINHPVLGRIEITYFYLSELTTWLDRPPKARVFHHVNGQTQFMQQRGFLTQCGLPGLKDKLIILIDASNLKEHSFFKADRQSLINNPTAKIYESFIRDAIKENQELRQIARFVKDKQLEEVAQITDTRTFDDLVKQDPMIQHLLDDTKPLIKRSSPEKTNGILDNYQGKRSPTFLRWKAKKNPASFNLDEKKGGRFILETDVENNYFSRLSERGEWRLEFKNDSSFCTCRASLSDGNLNISLKPSKHVGIGTKESLRLILEDRTMSEPVMSEFAEFTIFESRREKKKKPYKKNRTSEKAFNPPPAKFLTKDGREIDGQKSQIWPENFDSNHGGYAEDIGEDGRIYYINWDNAHRESYERRAEGEGEKKLSNKHYELGMLLSMVCFENALRKHAEEIRESRTDVDVIRRFFATAASQFVLPLIQTVSNVQPNDDEND